MLVKGRWEMGWDYKYSGGKVASTGNKIKFGGDQELVKRRLGVCG